MTVRTLISQLLQCRRIFLRREFAEKGDSWFPIKDKYVTVEIKDTGGRVRKIKSVKLKKDGKFSAHPTVEITLTSSSKGW